MVRTSSTFGFRHCLLIGICSTLGCDVRHTGGKCGAEQEDLQALLQHGRVNFARQASPSGATKGEEVLGSILTGGVSKREIEIVLAHYNEDISWSDPYENIRTVYCKGKKRRGCIALENVGREGHTYLHHIVANYDTLSNWTVFTQAQAPTQGYEGHRQGGGHMLPGVAFDGFVLPEDAGGLPREDGSVFVFTSALHMGTLNHTLRLSFKEAKTQSPTMLHLQSKCPDVLLDGWQRWWDLGWFKNWIGKRCGVEASETPKAFNEYWDQYIGLDRPTNDIIFFAQGARFAASRDRIRQRPLAFYKKLLDLVSKNQDPCANYFNEWLWYYIIGKPSASPCDPRQCLIEATR